MGWLLCQLSMNLLLIILHLSGIALDVPAFGLDDEMGLRRNVKASTLL